MAATTPLTAAPAALAMNRFIETEDLSLLEKPLLFETNQTQFRKLLCCQGGLVSAGLRCGGAQECGWPCAAHMQLR
jgi:hypothetical protein